VSVVLTSEGMVIVLSISRRLLEDLGAQKPRTEQIWGCHTATGQ